MASVVLSRRELVAPMAEQHIPVLLEEVVRSLHPHLEGVYIDGTVGRGGHAAAIMDGAGGHARLLGLDADPRSLTLAGETLAQFGNAVALQEGNFRHIAALAEESGFAPWTASSWTWASPACSSMRRAAASASKTRRAWICVSARDSR